MLPGLDQPPRGFSVEHRGDDLEITYRRHGMGCMVVFLMVWCTGWGVGMIILAGAFVAGDYSTVNPDKMHPLIMVFFLIAGTAAEAFVLYLLAFMLFGKTVIRLQGDWIAVERVLFGWKRRKVARRDAIAAVTQVKDGGEGSDSFPSWGLQLEAQKTIDVLVRQRIEKSDWLGPILAEWAAAPYKPAIRG